MWIWVGVCVWEGVMYMQGHTLYVSTGRQRYSASCTFSGSCQNLEFPSCILGKMTIRMWINAKLETEANLWSASYNKWLDLAFSQGARASRCPLILFNLWNLPKLTMGHCKDFVLFFTMDVFQQDKAHVKSVIWFRSEHDSVQLQHSPEKTRDEFLM